MRIKITSDVWTGQSTLSEEARDDSEYGRKRKGTRGSPESVADIFRAPAVIATHAPHDASATASVDRARRPAMADRRTGRVHRHTRQNQIDRH